MWFFSAKAFLKANGPGKSLRIFLLLHGLTFGRTRRARKACRALSPRDCILVVGTTGAVYPAAGLPEAAIAAGVPLVEVNLDPSPISSAATVFLQVRGGGRSPLRLRENDPCLCAQGRAKELIPELVRLVMGEDAVE